MPRQRIEPNQGASQHQGPYKTVITTGGHTGDGRKTRDSAARHRPCPSGRPRACTASSRGRTGESLDTGSARAPSTWRLQVLQQLALMAKLAARPIDTDRRAAATRALLQANLQECAQIDALALRHGEEFEAARPSQDSEHGQTKRTQLRG